MNLLQKLYASMLKQPCAATMLVFADALEERDHDAVAFAYRWAAHRGKWPMKRNASWRVQMYGTHRTLRSEPKFWQCYDWDVYGRQYFINVPESAMLTYTLWNAIKSEKHAPNKYGGVHRAFKLLAEALCQLQCTY